jgi:uncharacterized protein (TIGR03437 family)
MTRNRKIFIGKCAAIFAVPTIIWAFASGPPAGHAGVPGEETCAQAGCHVGTQVNGGGGAVAIALSGGSSYVPGVKQQVTVTINDAQARVYGMQMTARLVSDLKAPAGTFTPVQEMTVLCSNGSLADQGVPRQGGSCPTDRLLEFIEHTLPRNSNTFTFEWTPPASNVGEVRLFVAGNAANGNGQNSGDRIYTSNVTLGAQASGPRPTISSVEVDGSFRAGIVAGSWVAIKGTELAPTPSPGRTWNSATEIVDGRLPTALDNVSVNINSKPAAVYFVSGTQINVQAPADEAIGPVEVEVVRSGVRSDVFRANLQRHLPGFFMFTPEGSRYIAGVHADGTFLGKTSLFPTLTLRTAAPGNTVLLFGTGFGPTNPSVQTGIVFSGAAPTTEQVRITIGGVQANVAFAGLSGAGLYQFNVVVPDLPNGDHAVVAEIGGVRSQENAFITVQR